MLILTRKANERIFIGDGIALVVLNIENNRVKLGIEAPADVPIVREEIADNVTKLTIDENLKSYIEPNEVVAAKTNSG